MFFTAPTWYKNMNTLQTVSKNSFASDSSGKFSLGSLFSARNFEKSLVIKKTISVEWLYKLYKGTVVASFWTVLSSPVEYKYFDNLQDYTIIGDWQVLQLVVSCELWQ